MVNIRCAWFQFALASMLFSSPACIAFSQTELTADGHGAANNKLDPESRALHDKLAKYLRGTKWKGQFTMEGHAEPRTEHYEIISAEKGAIGDYWNLVARIKYGEHDKTFPLPPIEIKFAGRTPVITVDQVFFPGFGKFDARVLIRKGQYAGTWAHSDGVGGHLFGTIEKMEPEEVQTKVDAAKEQKHKTESN